MKNRRGLNEWWEGLKPLAEALGGKTPLLLKKVNAGILGKVSSYRQYKN